MVSTITVFPRLPSPPETPDVRYLSDLVRALEVVITQIQNNKEVFFQIPGYVFLGQMEKRLLYPN